MQLGEGISSQLSKHRRSSWPSKRGSQAGNLKCWTHQSSQPCLFCCSPPPPITRALNPASLGTGSIVRAVQKSFATFSHQFAKPNRTLWSHKPHTVFTQPSPRLGRRGKRSPARSRGLPRLTPFPRGQHAATRETQGLGKPVPRPGASAHVGGSGSPDQRHGQHWGSDEHPPYRLRHQTHWDSKMQSATG